MATYRFRVTFEDYDDVTRDIEIRSTQTFEELHYAIQNAIGFDASKQTSFYLSDDNWKKGKEITTRDLKNDENEKASPVRNSRLCDLIIDPHQKIYYLFDPAAVWTFRVELVKINREEDINATYPRVVKSAGEAPKQYPVTSAAALPVPEDFDLTLDDETGEEEESEETDDLLVDETEIPVGEEKVPFKTDVVEDSDEDFETADDDASDDESIADKDDF
jgi:hypothetical protein